MHKLLKLIATGFYSGYSLYFPGTVGTLVAIPLILLTNSFSIFTKFILFVIFFIIGIVASEYYEHYYEKSDPEEVVIDEIVAFFLIMTFFKTTLLNILIAFIIFRIFDIWKPYPIRKVEKSVSGGVGIMIDDIIAAIYTMIILSIIRVFT